MTAHPPHPCPGGCGADVPYERFACSGCWYRLPGDFRRRISRAWRSGTVAEHGQAMRAARLWFVANPPRAAKVKR